MKHFKKIMTSVLAASMLASMAVPAYAAEENEVPDPLPNTGDTQVTLEVKDTGGGGGGGGSEGGGDEGGGDSEIIAATVPVELPIVMDLKGNITVPSDAKIINHTFDLEGNARFEGEAHNAWRGGMAVWRIMELRHLPPFPPQYGMERHRYSTFPVGGKENPMKEIWDLADNPDVPVDQRIVLFTTFDKCLVKKEDLPRVIKAFRAFEGEDHQGETNLEEQADILEEIAKDPEVIAVGWNQTSVNADSWSSAGGYDSVKDEPIPYNCLTGNDHYWLFDDLKEENLSE